MIQTDYDTVSGPHFEASLQYATNAFLIGSTSAKY